MTVSGTVKKIMDTQTFESGFQKREIVLTTDEQYPQHILIQFVQEKVGVVDTLKVEDTICVHIGLRGREWVSPDGVTKYFNSIQGWRIEKLNQGINPEIPPVPPIEELTSSSSASEEDDDLPF